VPNYEPNLDLFRRVFGSDISDCRAELIKSALGWSCVYRLTLTREGQPLRESVIVKTIDSAAPLDKFQAERELRFYETLHPRLDIPKARVHFLHTDEAAGVHLIILEDLAPRLWIPAHPYQWTAGEIKAILRAYEAPLSEALAAERQAFALLAASPDRNEGIAAFLEKRPPRFVGR